MEPLPNRGESKQDYQTPHELLHAVRERLYISSFDIDVAASAENAVAINYYDEAMDGLAPHNSWEVTRGGWAWCNPPFANIAPWVEKAARQAALGVSTVMLVPASVGTNWWRDWVCPHAYVSFLVGRLTFVGAPSVYPKECALLLYTPWSFTGHDYWEWKKEFSR